MRREKPRRGTRKGNVKGASKRKRERERETVEAETGGRWKRWKRDEVGGRVLVEIYDRR